MNGDRDVLAQAAEWVSDGHAVAIATVIQTWGSSPRQPGSQLAVRNDGFFTGSVSGGCVEAAVIDEALQVMCTGEPVLLEFGVTDETAWSVGLACGGHVQIYVEPVQ